MVEAERFVPAKIVLPYVLYNLFTYENRSTKITGWLRGSAVYDKSLLLKAFV
jgi:hypothetical protein